MEDASDTYNVMMGDNDGTHHHYLDVDVDVDVNSTHPQEHQHQEHHAREEHHGLQEHQGHQEHHEHQHHHFDSMTMESLPSENLEATTGLYHDGNNVSMDDTIESHKGELVDGGRGHHDNRRSGTTTNMNMDMTMNMNMNMDMNTNVKMDMDEVVEVPNDKNAISIMQGSSNNNGGSHIPNDQGQEQPQDEHQPPQPQDHHPEQKQNKMSIEERQIHESLLQQREEAHAKLQATLVRVHETTKTMLNEIGHFLESTESVMIDYTKCQNSQREEARRLEEVEPDVAGATERYLAQVQGMMMQK